LATVAIYQQILSEAFVQPKAYLLSLISYALMLIIFMLLITLWDALGTAIPANEQLLSGRVSQTDQPAFTLLITDSYTTYLPIIARPLVIVPANNGGFEEGPTQWDEFSTVQQQLIRAMPALEIPPHSGSWAATLGNYDDEISMISTGITIDKDIACLVYWQWVQSKDACGGDYGGVGVNGNWHHKQSLCAGTSTARWVQQSITLTRYTTMPVVLNFAVTTDYSVPSKLYIDDIAFRSTAYCDTQESGTVQDSFATDEGVGQPIIPGKASDLVSSE